MIEGRTETAVTNTIPTGGFSMLYNVYSHAPIALQIITDREVISPTVTLDGIVMPLIAHGHCPTCTCGRRTDHRYQLINPPMGMHLISGTFERDVLYVVRAGEPLR
jgi:hypothetical protein